MGSNKVAALTAQIASSYLRGRNGRVDSRDIGALLITIGGALRNPEAEAPARVVQRLPARTEHPAVPINKSITGDYLICLESGKKFKSLKRHLRAKYGMSPDQYREKWGLSSDYPMTAPNFAKIRAKLALANGLGTREARHSYGRPRLAAVGGKRR